MKTSAAFLSLVAGVCAQGVTSAIAPQSSAPAGCSASFSGDFEITVALVNGKRDESLTKRSSCGSNGALLLKLSNGILTDAKDRTGYIASNYQFQFDGPPQAGAIYTAGFSVCGNNALALGGSTTWWQCRSGDFYNLYDRNWAPQCEAVEILAMSCDGSAPPPATGTPPVGQISDGQIQATTGAPVGQISDGQIQATTAGAAPTGAPVGQISDGQIQATTAGAAPTGAPVGQISDGQIQATTAGAAPTGAPVGQISDGQIQATTAGAAPTGAPVGQISDGQIQATSAGAAPTGAPVGQISDGQIQATSAGAAPTGAPVGQISDGQIQATSAAAAPTGAPVSQISDGQVQVNTASTLMTYATQGNTTAMATSGMPGKPSSTVVPVSGGEAVRAPAGLGMVVSLVVSLAAAYFL
ncbi:hypothetical protein SEPCBS119000_001365 [Sporothrix epigloea]|uniref:Cell wall mannoprotein PIR1-like C-terminal domain-containing protein n=1 Tax=Sporothrix epigloea TaxID=1892477 RepID=A0ABP0DAB1_9PEZI